MDTAREDIVFTNSQQAAFNMIMSFIDSDDQKVFILKGYAGTGKTTMVRAVIKELQSRYYRYVLLASTGRAAKVLSDSAQYMAQSCHNNTVSHIVQAKTIHSEIYTFDGINQDLDLFGKPKGNSEIGTHKGIRLRFTLKHKVDPRSTIYIVDEASMISDNKEKSLSQAVYGSDNRLLKDLLEYDGNGKYIFIGDACQLPPVNQTLSPALSKDYLYCAFGIKAIEAELTEIVRQTSGNDIVYSASKIRKRIDAAPICNIAKFPFKGYKNIKILSTNEEMLKLYIEDIKRNGYTKSTLITMTNKQISDTSSIVRYSLGLGNNNLSVGDLLLVTQNNALTPLMNGDLIRVLQIGHKERRAGLTFVSVEVESITTPHKVYNTLLIEEVIYSGLTNLTQSQQTHLMIDFHYRMKDNNIKQGSATYNDQMREDNYLNALRCVYGYALTCHKSQGGEWDNVYLLMPRNMPYITPRSYVYRWVYTAMTRARKTLYVINDYWVE